ncbi:methylated-DNA--[protein]-cysteine S-methyltransferase [Cellulomonas fimi]|uniref:Methylated-DNA--protein-cysteine methyltransferase n=1 Tax=Cellulomonas fimi (strain ATCC 484 / DSM 20113 / JCM 1341 / CCUG 24087 / LMG 16345 / NBRC 15513 / NCIMB 8980 / NCTC 7547 / NRS-133) TaxID=590998 RepID=F4H423_CELFA|nr:methylated-DNA--[protein]-cysteine S-methyltransferase [Cellulomonas fimi]AEE45375.1 methylated-DNA/protein-cysteine methyltransferase [Cellulomonas fimi ATCC 484]VEH29161.1 Methylated-DNA--protein-cysteine methyltransferase, inducible [Cellulomonas fimi]
MSGMGVRVVERPDGPTVHAVVESGMGPVTLIGVDEVLTGLLLPSTRERNVVAAGAYGPRTGTALRAAATQVTEYLAGDRTEFDLDVHLVGSAFQVRVWEGLLRIPYGTTWTYGELAADIGHDPRTSSRAVGAANGANRIAVVVPCHRVIGANGTLTGFAAGVERKRYLLDLESPPVAPEPTLL